MENQKAEFYKAMIQQLDNEHNELLANQPDATGNNKAVYETIASRMVAQNNYRIQREKLVKALEEAEGPSPEVAAFIAPQKPPVSKFDLDSGAAQLDTSLNPLGGRAI